MLNVQREHWLLGAAYHTWNTSTGSSGLFLCSCQYYFGGWCGHGSCYHISVHTLSTSTLQWRILASTTSENGAPMKSGCGFVYFTDVEVDLLFVVGGYGTYPLVNKGHSINKLMMVVSIPMNNTFSACPQVSAILCCSEGWYHHLQVGGAHSRSQDKLLPHVPISHQQPEGVTCYAQKGKFLVVDANSEAD